MSQRTIPAGARLEADGSYSLAGRRKFSMTQAGVAEMVAPAFHGSILEIRFTGVWQSIGGPVLVIEHPFDGSRRRFDFAHLTTNTAIEIEGGVYGGKGHSSAKGYTKDCEKYNAAILAGWRVFRLTSPMITVEKLKEIKDFLEKQL